MIFLLFCCSALSSAPQAIVFDFGGVVVKAKRHFVLSFLSESLGIDAKKEFEGDKLYLAIEEGEKFWQQYAASQGKILSSQWFADLDERVNQIAAISPEMHQLLTDLKTQGFRIALLSNTTLARSRFFRRQNLYVYFDPILLSCECNLRKPSSKIYQLLLTMLNLPAEACLFIDNKKRNIDAAHRLGFATLHFKTFAEFKTDLLKNISPCEKVLEE